MSLSKDDRITLQEILKDAFGQDVSDSSDNKLIFMAEVEYASWIRVLDFEEEVSEIIEKYEGQED